jgi:hypothetical protein
MLTPGSRCKDIMWTMEWLFEDGSRQITEARSNDLLSDAFQAAEKTKTKKRKRHTGTTKKQPPRKQARSAEPPSRANSITGLIVEENVPELKEALLKSNIDPTASDSIVEQNILDDTEVPSNPTTSIAMTEEEDKKEWETRGKLPLDSETASVMAQDDVRWELEELPNLTSDTTAATPVSSLVGYSTPSSEEPSSGPDSDLEDECERDELEEVKDSATSSPKKKSPRRFLYLVKQRVSGSQRVLIPINPKNSIRENLRKKEILEFPTIQVLSVPSKSLPGEFMLEADYLVKFRKDQEEMERLLSSAPELTGMAQKTRKPEPAVIVPNADDILDILRRDIE